MEQGFPWKFRSLRQLRSCFLRKIDIRNVLKLFWETENVGHGRGNIGSWVANIFCWYFYVNILKFSVTNCCLKKTTESWHSNFAFFKAEIRECPNITKFVRGWSKGGLDSLAWQYAWSGCELHMIGKIFFDMFGKKYTLKRGGTKWSPLPPFLENPSPLPQFGKWLCGGVVRFTENLESIKLLIFDNMV